MKTAFGMAAAAAFAFLAACSGGESDQAAIDAAVEKALAERDREDAEKYRALPESAPESARESAAPEAEASPQAGRAAYSTENLREGYPDGMATPYGMCIRTLSIVGEHCGCMVNRATDAGIPGGAQMGMFGGDGKRASKAQAEEFTRIVKSCSGYNITVKGAGRTAEPEVASAAPRGSPPKGRRVGCYFGNGIYEYDGACSFEAGPGGDFVTTSLNGAYFEGVTRIGLDVTGKGVGTLEIYYPDGAVQQTAVRRSTRDKACWEAPRLTFCAR